MAPRTLTARILGARTSSWVSFVVVAGCVLFILAQLSPWWLIRNTTPTGGDMGAHVWGPAYLRDHLLPHGRLTGWTPDWYGGFPAYTYYMVVPSLLIVLLDVLLPYAVAFKLVAVSGLLTLPIACWAFGRLARLPFPIPPALAVGATVFVFDMGFSIYGGNVASTMAGEFAFSISLTLAILYLGVVLRGLETGRHRALAAILLALTGLCHLIPAIFAAGVTLVIACAYVGVSLAEGAVAHRRDPHTLARGVLVVALLLLLAEAQLDLLTVPPPLWALVVAVAVVALGALSVERVEVAEPEDGALAPGGWARLRPRLTWGLTAVPVGALLAAWWVAPFYGLSAYLNDMGWEKLQPWDDPTNTGAFDIRDALFARDHLPGESLQDLPAIQLMLVLAGLGFVASLLFRHRAGLILGASAVALGLAFAWLPEGRFWNARILPFYYLVLDLLGAIALAEIGRSIAVGLARDPRRPVRAVVLATPIAIGSVALVFLGLALRVLPGGTTEGTGTYSWGPVHWSGPRHFAPAWARWNFTGLEEKPAYPEFAGLIQTMQRVGEERGCGMSMWEYHGDILGRYGTPMAPMLLPYFSDSCIGSMEGLYFEASASTPFHFLLQDQLSEKPSNAQRDLPYAPGAPTADVADLGVTHLQLYGVRYYLAATTHMIELADAHPDLTRIATSDPWVVYEVRGADVVEPLRYEPAVVQGVEDEIHSWLPMAVSWYQDRDAQSVLLGRSGPESWQRVAAPAVPEEEQTLTGPIGAPLPEIPELRSLPEIEVSDIHVDRDRIRFRVSEPGVPVLVKTSYFPSWEASGAEGPWRVFPNLMVVVPTEEVVELRYGREPIEVLSGVLSLLGLALVVVLARRRPLQLPSPPQPADPQPSAPPTVSSAALPTTPADILLAPPSAGDRVHVHAGAAEPEEAAP